jgi:hypothetical protein
MEKASRLLANVKVKARVAALRELVKDGLWETFGWDQRRILGALIEIIETPVGEVGPGHRLCQEWSREKVGGGANDGPAAIRTKVKMPAKLDAIREINKMAGHYAPEKVDHRISAEPTVRDLIENLAACHALGWMMREFPEAARAFRDGLDGLDFRAGRCELASGSMRAIGETVRVA